MGSQGELEASRISPKGLAVTWASSLPSIGASLHMSGQCKPCGWFWKPNGCQWGADCKHCHLCPEGELKRRKQSKQAQLKEQNLWSRVVHKELKASQRAT